jgi:ABC-type antimicrobial peptide transport system permease subunit
VTVAGVPLSYNVRGLFVRRTSTILTVIGIGATVAVLAGVLALQQGFATLFAESGREDIAVFLRPGATSEGESAFQRSRADILVKSTDEIAQDESGRPLASAETYLAVRLRKLDGGETNVPIRGVEQMSFDLRGEDVRIAEGRRFLPGTDEVVVGRSLTSRIRGCAVGEVIVLNTTPFRVVGVFDHDGPFASEIWGDVERMMGALERPVYSRVIARLRPDADLAALTERLESDKQVPAKVLSEREYLTGQTAILSGILIGLGAFLALVMGTAAVFTGTNTMLAALSARTHEIGVLLSIGFRPLSIFTSFVRESLLLGLLGGIVGTLLVIPLNGVRTGTTNFQTFTEVAFAFRVTPTVLATAIAFAVLLGLLGGAWPAWRAARLEPTEAMRRG